MIPLAIGVAILDKNTRHTCLETNTFLLLATLGAVSACRHNNIHIFLGYSTSTTSTTPFQFCYKDANELFNEVDDCPLRCCYISSVVESTRHFGPRRRAMFGNVKLYGGISITVTTDGGVVVAVGLLTPKRDDDVDPEEEAPVVERNVNRYETKSAY
jgi:hypothetical protein